VHTRVIAVLLFVSVASLALAAQTGKIEPIGAVTDSRVAEGVKKVLEPKGYRVSLDDGSVVCEIWLRNKIPAQPKKDSPGALYSQLAESALVGVISFPQATTDYRGQNIPKGAYTLRYELIPNDGNHLGVAPNRDFVLLVPAASDDNPDATFKFDELVSLSRKATGTKHPGPLSLVQPESGTAAAVSKDDEDHWIFSGAIRLASGEDLPIALIVKGTPPQ
jgi:hypothetical protein